MKNIKFNPWVGADYFSGGLFGIRIMVLGESHYCGELCKGCETDFKSRCSGFTTNVVRAYLDTANEREGWMSTYLKFERSLVNHETVPAESSGIWNSLLFYNFLQLAMQGPRQAGTAQQYRDAAQPFFEVLDKYQPDLLIVWGKRLWGNLPGERWKDGEEKNVDGRDVDNGYYMLSGGKTVRVVCVYHPSVGYSWDYWYKAITVIAGDNLLTSL